MIYRAIVVDNADPSGTRAVKVQCPQLYGGEISGWVSACVPVSEGDSPSIGDTVWVALEGNDRNRPVWIGKWATSGYSAASRKDFVEIESIKPVYRSAVHLLFAQNTGPANYGGSGSTASSGNAASGGASAVAAAQNSPRCIRYTSSASAGVAAGVTSFSTLVCRGASTDWATAGFEFSATVRLNDASYDYSAASTGSRIGVGVSSLVAAADSATVLGSDSLSSNFVGFVRRSVSGGAADVCWTLASRDGTTLSTLATEAVFYPQRWYTLSIGCKPGDNRFYWKIIDRSTDNLYTDVWYPSYYPAASTMLGGLVAVQTVNATARSIDLANWALVASE